MNNIFSETGPGRTSYPALAVFLLALVLFFTDLGATSLPSKDDAYHAQTAKEMLQRLDPVGISMGGDFTFQSSPLPNWLMAVSYVAFGINEYAARFPSALLAFFGVVAVYSFIRKRYGESTAVCAAFILLTSFLYLRLARDAMAEIPLAFFSLLALLAFIRTQEEIKHAYIWFGIWTGLAILTKSALGALPLIIAGVYFIATRRFRKLFSYKFILGSLTALAVAAIWYVPALLIYGDVFIESHFGAYLGVHTFSGHHSDLGLWGVFFYFLWLPLHYLPWIILLIPSLYWSFKRWRESTDIPILWLAVVVPIVVLSLITSKYTRYLMPVFPPAAMLIAISWKSRLNTALQEKLVGYIGWLSLVAALAIIVLPIPLAQDRNASIRSIAPAVRQNTLAEEPILNFNLDLWSYRAPLLFYSDRVLNVPEDDPDKLFDEFQLGEQRLILTSPVDLDLILKATPEGIDVTELSSAYDLVLLKASTPSSEIWSAELGLFIELIGMSEPSGVLGSYHIPRSELNSLMRSQYGVNIMQEIDKPKRLFRRMERQGTRTGFAWRGAELELRNVPYNTHKVSFLAYSEHLVLFQIERIAEDADEDTEDDL